VRGQCDNNAGGSCTRIQRYSNPNVRWGPSNLPVGSAESDNVKRLNKVIAKVAGFYKHAGNNLDESKKVEEGEDSSPTNRPSEEPVQKPTEGCSDTPLEFYFYNNKLMDCGTIQEDSSLCSNQDIQSVCPKTCKTCNSQIANLDPKLTFKFYHDVKHKTVKKSCSMIANYPEVRCKFDGISETCRATCKDYR